MIVQIVQIYSYRHAESIIEREFPAEHAEILTIINNVDWVQLATPKQRPRANKVFDLSQGLTNTRFEEEFGARGWEVHPLIVTTAASRLVADFKKNHVQVEIQFGNMARWYTDVFKFLLSYAANDIEVGVLIAAMQATANRFDENVVYFERIARELPHAKMAITIPIWVIGVGHHP